MPTDPIDRRTARPARWGRKLSAGQVRCELCPRRCEMAPGQRGLCFVRGNLDGALVTTTWGRSSGFCVDPIEKKPLNHFLPGTPVLSFGTAGCNLTCRYCQNSSISRSRSCGAALVERDWYTLQGWHLTAAGACAQCGTPCPGHFEAQPGTWGRRRLPVRIG